jgi:SAM-dependent methyltransferase
LKKEELVNKEGIVWDINNVPFPLKDNQFDFSVALQVWEHLDNQQNAFKELYRISKNIILSFPYKWKSTKCNRHYNITDEKINEWTCNLPYNEYFIIGKKHKRKICIWRK